MKAIDIHGRIGLTISQKKTWRRCAVLESKVVGSQISVAINRSLVMIVRFGWSRSELLRVVEPESDNGFAIGH